MLWDASGLALLGGIWFDVGHSLGGNRHGKGTSLSSSKSMCSSIEFQLDLPEFGRRSFTTRVVDSLSSSRGPTNRLVVKLVATFGLEDEPVELPLPSRGHPSIAISTGATALASLPGLL